VFFFFFFAFTYFFSNPSLQEQRKELKKTFLISHMLTVYSKDNLSSITQFSTQTAFGVFLSTPFLFLSSVSCKARERPVETKKKRTEI